MIIRMILALKFLYREDKNMKKSIKRRLSIFLCLAMAVTQLSGIAFASSENVQTLIFSDGAAQVTSGGVYKLTSDAAGTISVNTTESVTLVGGYDLDKNLSETDNSYKFSALTIDCSKQSGVNLKLENMGITGPADNVKSIIDFTGKNNVLTLSGINLIEHQPSGYSTSKAAIHVGSDSALKINGSGVLYLYKSSAGSGIGGNPAEMNGDITFGDSASKDFRIFAKGTKQGALIGAGADAKSDTAIPGNITFENGIYNLMSTSRGACIGGSAGAGGASSGTNVYFNGGSININVDYTGSAVGGGGYDSGNDSSGGKAYFDGASVRMYVDKNVANASQTGYSGAPLSTGINDAAMTAERLNSSDAKVYKCIFDTSKLKTKADSFTVTVDGKDFYKGGLHDYKYINESLEKDEQISSSPTPLNWVASEDKNLYFYLTGEDHTIKVNGEEFTAKFNSESASNAATYTTSGVFDVTSSEEGSTVSSVTVTGHDTITSLTYDAIKKAADTAGESTKSWHKNMEGATDNNITAKFVKVSDLLGTPDCSFSFVGDNKTAVIGANDAYIYFTEDGELSSAKDGSIGAYWVTGITTIGLVDEHSYEDGTCSNCGVNEPVNAVNTDWYNTDAKTFNITTAAQLRGLAAIVNGTADGITKDNFANKTVTLGENIDISGSEWTPVGDATNAFAGTFDGQGKIISGLSITSGAGGYKGLFGNNTGIVKDFTISGSIGSADAYLTSGFDNIGGAVGYNNGTVSGVTGNVKVYVKTNAIYAVGGIVGRNGNNGIITKCINKADIEGTKNVGGIVGNNYNTVSMCVNTGNITSNGGQEKNFIGGIVGLSGDKKKTYTSTITSCYSTGNITNTAGKGIGGIAGMGDGATTITNCYAIGAVSGYGYVNPTIGQIEGVASYNYCLDTRLTQYDPDGIYAIPSAKKEGNEAKTATEMKGAEFVALLNEKAPVSGIWKASSAEKNDGYPILYFETGDEELVQAALVVDKDSVDQNGTVTLKLQLSATESKAISSFEASFTYDETMFTAVSAVAEDFGDGVDVKATIKGLGNAAENKVSFMNYSGNIGTEPVTVATLTFTAGLKTGDAEFKVTNAVIGYNETVTGTNADSLKNATVNVTEVKETGIADDLTWVPENYKFITYTTAAKANYAYDGNLMYYSEKLSKDGKYVYLYITADDVDADGAETKIAAASEGTCTSVAGDGDVNNDGTVSIIDAQIASDLSNSLFKSGFDPCTMLMRFEADVNGDMDVDAGDARAIQYYIHYGTFEVPAE